MLMYPVEYNPDWPAQFEGYRSRLRFLERNGGVTIDHIGSTAVEGLWAKPIIDMQIGVPELAAFDLAELSKAGFQPAREITADEPFPDRCAPDASWQKKYARLVENRTRLAHVHVRQIGQPNYRFALLFRDFLRQSPATCAAYSDFKRAAAAVSGSSSRTGGSGSYLDLKGPVMNLIALSAEEWARRSGWQAPS